MNDFLSLKGIVLDRLGLGPNGPAHDADSGLPEFFRQDDRAVTSSWSAMGGANFDHVEVRGAFICAQDEWLSQPVPIQVAAWEHYGYYPSGWRKEFDVYLNGTGMGGHLGDTARPTEDPYQHTHGRIDWTPTEGGYSTAMMPADVIMSHFWGSRRWPMSSGYSGELTVACMRLGAPTVGSPPPRVLGTLGIDYYSGPAMNSTRAPGPGIGRMIELTTEWQIIAWMTPTPGTPYDPAEVSQWIDEHGLPDVAAMQFMRDNATTPPPGEPVDPTPTDPAPVDPPSTDFETTVPDPITADVADFIEAAIERFQPVADSLADELEQARRMQRLLMSALAELETKNAARHQAMLNSLEALALETQSPTFVINATTKPQPESPTP